MFQVRACDTLEEHTTELQPPVFSAPEGCDLVQRQPTANASQDGDAPDDVGGRGTRRQIPISTIDWQSASTHQVMARDGIDFLRGLDQLRIQQTVELSDLMSDVRSENRYRVMIPHGETLYYATETSTESQRMLCGPHRAFHMTLYDHTHQEALRLRRHAPLGCCSIWCRTQDMEVRAPDAYVGRVRQAFSLSAPAFELYGEHGALVYRVEGPTSLVSAAKEAHFGIYSSDGLTQLGSINHQWDQVQNEYNIAVTFPGRRDDPRHKAIIIGAAFLLEYTYFVHAKKSGSRCWC